jgi:hypothetical protein
MEEETPTSSEMTVAVAEPAGGPDKVGMERVEEDAVEDGMMAKQYTENLPGNACEFEEKKETGETEEKEEEEEEKDGAEEKEEEKEEEEEKDGEEEKEEEEEEEEEEQRPMDAPMIGARLEIYWDGDGDCQWYSADVVAFDQERCEHVVFYHEDGLEETVQLLDVDWRPAPLVGSLIEVYWEDDDEWYAGEVVCEGLSGGSDGAETSTDGGDDVGGGAPGAACRNSRRHKIRYTEDGVEERLDLRYEMWRLSAAKPPREPVQKPYRESNGALLAYVQSLGGHASLIDGCE